jgi:small-conductance mechanosensitive channel
MDGITAALDGIRAAIADAGHTIVTHLPQLFGAVALILIGWLIAGWLRRLARSLAARLNRGLDRVLRTDRVQRIRLSPALMRLLSNLIFWVVILGFVTAAARVAEFDVLSGWLERIVAYLPKLLAGALIIVAGYLIGAIVRDLVVDALDSARIAQRALMGRLAQAATFLAAIVIGIDQIGVDVTFVTTMIAIVLAVVLAGFSLAFGLGSRQAVANLLASHALQRQFSIGHRARIGGVEGEILEFTATAVVLATAEGRVTVPASRFDVEPSVLLAPESRSG